MDRTPQVNLIHMLEASRMVAVTWHSSGEYPDLEKFSRLRMLAVVDETVLSGTFYSESNLFMADNGDAIEFQNVLWWSLMPAIPEK